MLDTLENSLAIFDVISSFKNDNLVTLKIIPHFYVPRSGFLPKEKQSSDKIQNVKYGQDHMFLSPKLYPGFIIQLVVKIDKNVLKYLS